MFSMTVTTDNPSQFNAVIAAFSNAETKNIAPLTATEAHQARNDARRALIRLESIVGVNPAFALLLEHFNTSTLANVRPEEYVAVTKAAAACITVVTAWLEEKIKAAKE